MPKTNGSSSPPPSPSSGNGGGGSGTGGGRRTLVVAVVICFCVPMVILQLSREWRDGLQKYVESMASEIYYNTAPSTELAFRQSYGFFDDIPDDVWRSYHKNRARDKHFINDHNRDRIPGPGKLWIYNNYDPYFACPRIRKIGGLGDGPKWMCDIDRLVTVANRRAKAAAAASSSTRDRNNGKNSSHCLIYSVGSNGNFQFEDDIYDKIGTTCEIHTFDPKNYDRPEKSAKQNMHFHTWGLGSSYDEVQKNAPSSNLKTFEETRKALGHENRTIDIFKIDCEGCEWISYKDWLGADIRQILMETHGVPPIHEDRRFNYPEGLRMSNFLDDFTDAGFALFAREVNSGWSTGNCVEWAFIKLHPDFWKDDEQQMIAASSSSQQQQQ